MKALIEIRTYLASWLLDLRAQRAYAAIVEVETLADIAAEGQAAAQTLAATAHGAEVADLEAGRLLDAVMADGVVTPAEFPQLRLARRHLNRSAAHDHCLAEKLIT